MTSRPLSLVRLVAAAACAGASFFPEDARADAALTIPKPPLPTPIDALGNDLVDAFTGYNLFFYGGAVMGTGVMAYGGIDQAIRVGVQEHLAASAYGDASYYAGYVVPAVVAPGLYLVGLVAGDSVVAGAGSASVQSLGVALVAMSLLKVGVGRVYPLDGGDPSAPDRLDHPAYAHTFHPFQSVWPLPAWPSGHTLGTISVVAALTGYFPEEPWIPAIGYPLGVAIGCGMVVGDRHWASDVISGALLGHAIGYSIGKAFRLRARGGAKRAPELGLVPLVEPGLAGVAFGGTW